MHMSDEDYQANLRSVAKEGTEPVELFGLDVVEGELAVAQLPEASRMILALHYSESCSFAEIASVLGISEARAIELHTEALHLLGAVISLRRSEPKIARVVELQFARWAKVPSESEPPESA
jgi:RNA polymerase sigma factor for flagellar operon FliA